MSDTNGKNKFKDLSQVKETAKRSTTDKKKALKVSVFQETNPVLRFVKRYISTAKRKPLLAIVPLAILIIIIIAIIILSISCNGNKKAEEETFEIETLTHTQAETTDDSLWKFDGQFAYYDDAGYESIKGIDISEWSLDIDFEKVKNAGIDFVICRVGYRGYETGKFAFDDNLEEYLSSAYESGLRTGVYFVTQAVNEDEAAEEAAVVLEQIKGFKIEMPVYIDCEANTGVETRTDQLTKEDHTKNALAFCKTIEDAGYRAGIYSNEEWINSYLDISQLADYDIWLAKYTSAPYSDIPFNMWQYSASGSIDGIKTDADLNVRLERK